MKVSVDGTVYDFDPGKLGMREAYRIQEQTGLNLMRWQAGLQEFDVKAVAALVFLLQSRAGEKPDWDTFDFDLGSLEITDVEPVAEDPKAGASVAP